VLSDGLVVATWTHEVNKGTLAVTLDPIRKLAPATMKEVRSQADAMAEALGLDRASVAVA
jgi:hypothetical protein